MMDVLQIRQEQDVGLMGLLETRIRAKNFNKRIQHLDPNWNIVHNSSYSNGGQIWALWDELKWKFRVLHCSAQHITGLCTAEDGFQFQVSFVYAMNTIVDRRELWQDLKNLGASIWVLWLLLGDFNYVGSP